MKNKYYEEKDQSQSITDFHNKELATYNMPDWFLMECPDCGERTPLSGVRTVSLCFNARNIGDMTVEFHCQKCLFSDFFYFKENVKDMEEFSKYILGEKSPKNKPIIEKEMYDSLENNLILKMFSKKNER